MAQGAENTVLCDQMKMQADVLAGEIKTLLDRLDQLEYNFKNKHLKRMAHIFEIAIGNPAGLQLAAGNVND